MEKSKNASLVAAVYTIFWLATDLLLRHVVFQKVAQPFWNQLYFKSIVMTYFSSLAWLLFFSTLTRFSHWLALPLIVVYAALSALDFGDAYFMLKFFFTYLSKFHLLFLAQDLKYFWNAFTTYPNFYHYVAMAMVFLFFALTAARVSLATPRPPIRKSLKVMGGSVALYWALFFRLSPDDRHFVLLPNINTSVQSYQFTREWRHRAKLVNDQYELKKQGKLPLISHPMAMPELKTVVLIINESWGTDYFPTPRAGRNGMPLLTEWMRRSGDDFLLFPKAFTNSTATDVSWPSMLTGVGPEEPIDKLLSFPLVSNMAKLSGFHTALFSSQRLFWANLQQFLDGGDVDTFVDADVMKTPIVNDMGTDDLITAERIDQYLKTQVPADQRLLLIFGSNALHAPFQQSSNKLKEPMDPKWSNYEKGLHILDEATDSVFSSLKATGRFDDALIIMTGDHGEGMLAPNPVHRITSFYDYFTRIPFLIKVPSSAPESLRQNLVNNRAHNVQNLDIAPTLAHIFGICIPAAEAQENAVCSAYRGSSLTQPLANNRTMIAVNTNDVRRWDPEGFGVFTDERRLVFSSTEPELRFYDVSSDPQEKRNLWPDLSEEERKQYLALIESEKHLRRIYSKYHLN